MDTQGSRIRYARKLAGFKQQRPFADLMGVSVQAVSQWERDEGITNENLTKVAEITRVSLDWLANNRGERPSESLSQHEGGSDIPSQERLVTSPMGQHESKQMNSLPEPNVLFDREVLKAILEAALEALLPGEQDLHAVAETLIIIAERRLPRSPDADTVGNIHKAVFDAVRLFYPLKS
jgi:transcriptional regulator with XRE-family HTH domain